MWRHAIKPRPHWKDRVVEQGLVFPMTDMPDGSQRQFSQPQEVHIALPANQRFVNAATFRVLAGNRNAAVLERLGSGRWKILGDEDLVDTRDRHRVFAVGELTIYS